MSDDLATQARPAEPVDRPVTDGPVFLGGLSHSGKTPLRRLLELHPDLSMSRHSALWLRDDRADDDLSDPAVLDRRLAALAADPKLRRLAPDPEQLRAELRTGPHTATRLYGLVHAQHARRMGKARWGDQLGMVELVAAELLAAFPDARFVHLVRDPRDRLGALQRSTLRPGAVGWQTGRWLETVRLGLVQASRWPDRYRMVRYEELVAEPEATLRSVCALCGLEPTAEMLEAARTLALEPARDVAADHVRFVESATAGQLSQLGYVLTSAAADAGSTRGRSGITAGVRAGVERIGLTGWRLIGRRVSAARKEG